MDSPHPLHIQAAQIADLEAQLLISDATHQEQMARVVAELEGVYAECEVLKRAARDREMSRERTGVGGSVGDDVRRVEDTYRREVGSLQSHIADLENTLQSLHTQHAHLLASHTTTLSTLRGAELAYDDLHSTHTHLESQHVDLRAELEDLQERFGALERREGSLRQDWEILGEDYADLKDEIGLVHSEKRGLKSTIESQQQRITQLESSERNARESLEETAQQLSTSQQTAASLSVRLETLEESTSELTARAEKAEQDRLQVQVERVEATLARDTAEDAVERLEETVTELQTSLDALHAQQATWGDAKHSLESANETLTSDLTAARGENSKLELRVEKQRIEETKLKTELKNVKAERAGLQKRLKEAERGEKEVERMSKEVERLEGELERLDGELQGAQERCEELEREVEGKKGEVESVQKELSGVKEELGKTEVAEKTGKERITALEADVVKQKTTIADLEKTNANLQRRTTSLTTDLKRTTADLQGIKKEIVPLRLERDALKNEAKKLGSERNLLRHSLERLQREGGAAPIPAMSTTAGGSGTDGSTDALTALQAEHAAALASHTAEITRLHDERQEFKKYIDWVRPDREKLKDELKALRASFDQSEAEKKMLMSEVTRYLAQQQDTKPIISPVMEKAPMAASPTKNGHQQHEQLVQALGIIEQEFTKYRTRVEEELAEGKSAVAQVEMEKSMVEEEFGRFRLEQMRAREEWEREVGKYRREKEEKRKVVPPLTREIHAAIAGFLSGANAFRSLANFSAVSREVRQTSMPILYETLVLDDDGDEDWAYGIRVDLTAGLVLPSGWEFVRHLFMSNRHHDRIKTIIHAARTPTVGFLAVAFPQLRFHMTYHMRKTVPPNEHDRPPEYKRECALVVHQPVDTAVFHGILTTLPLKCWAVEKVKKVPNGHTRVNAGWNGRATGSGVNGTNGVVHVKQENTGPASVPHEEPELSVIGLVNGITDIRFLPAGRLVDRKRANLAVRYYHRLPTELSLLLEFTQDDRTVQCTLYELSQLFKRPTGNPPNAADSQMRLWCNDVSTRVYHALVLAICRIIPEANHDLRIVIYLSRGENLTIPRFEDIFSVAVRVFSDLWWRIPAARRDERGKRNTHPMFHLIGHTHDDVRVEGTIRARLADGGSTFTADVRARDIRGTSVHRSAIYPAIFPKS